MYYVYQITFGDCVYIGCTNNLRRRKDQHNENARKRTSKIGKYLDEKRIVLSEQDLSILCKCDNRAEALKTERETALFLDRSGITLLNDNYSHDCSRKGKNIGKTSKQYYVIDFVNRVVEFVDDLRQYCLKHDLNYKALQRTKSGMRYTSSGHKVFYKDDWDSETDKEKYISGAFVKELKNSIKEQVIRRKAKEYEVMFPDKHIENVKNLDEFARQHDLTSGTLHATLIKHKPTKGYQVLRRI